MLKFEYKKIIDCYLTEGELDELGEQGWELCGILYNYTYNQEVDCNMKAMFYFKRLVSL